MNKDIEIDENEKCPCCGKTWKDLEKGLHEVGRRSVSIIYIDGRKRYFV